jgi:hypothetical protein
MEPLSQQLSDLSDRAKTTEETVAAARADDREKLESKRTSLTAAIADRKAKAKEAAESKKEKADGWWNDKRHDAHERMGNLRAKVDERHSEDEAKKAEHRADEAEQDAADALAWAFYAWDRAECAVIDAALARADADASAHPATDATPAP